MDTSECAHHLSVLRRCLIAHLPFEVQLTMAEGRQSDAHDGAGRDDSQAVGGHADGGRLPEGKFREGDGSDQGVQDHE
eukprot:3030145-Pyramimonas_sp.AAC.1